MKNTAACLEAFEEYQRRLAKVLIDGGDGQRVKTVLQRMSFTDFASGWEAAEERLCVTLPEVPNRGLGYAQYANCLDDCRSAIHAAGVKTR